MENFIQWILDGIKWFLGTPLPYDTADYIFNVAKYATELFFPLWQEWINILLGGVN